MVRNQSWHFVVRNECGPFQEWVLLSHPVKEVTHFPLVVCLLLEVLSKLTGQVGVERCESQVFVASHLVQENTVGVDK